MEDTLYAAVEKLESRVWACDYTDPSSYDWWLSWLEACTERFHAACDEDDERCYELSEYYRPEYAGCFCGLVNLG